MSGDPIGQLTIEEVIPCAVRANDVTSSAIDIRDYVGRVALTLVSAAASTADTLDAKVQDCATSGGSYADISGATWTQVTAAADLTETIYIDADAQDRFIKVVCNLSENGDESFPFAVTLTGMKQVR